MQQKNKDHQQSGMGVNNFLDWFLSTLRVAQYVCNKNQQNRGIKIQYRKRVL